jgi:glycosyltransferase involved in cell wall biosynthesis
MKPRVSVLAPNYNYGRFLRRCVDSVLAQTYPSLELVVSDDASTDDSDSILRSYRDHRLVYERQAKNHGMIPNWERCAALSTAESEYMLLLGSDDSLKPTMLAECVKVLDSDPSIAFCHTGTEFVSDDNKLVAVTNAFQRSYVVDGLSRIEPFLRGKRVVQSSGVFRRSAWLELGGWSHDYFICMDLDLWFRMLLRWKVGFVGDLLVRYRSHPVSHGHTVMQAREDLRFLRSMFERLPSELAHLRNLEPELVRALCDERLPVLQALPISDERDAAVAELRQHASPGGQAKSMGSRLAPLRRDLALRCASLPPVARHLLGDLVASLSRPGPEKKT